MYWIALLHLCQLQRHITISVIWLDDEVMSCNLIGLPVRSTFSWQLLSQWLLYHHYLHFLRTTLSKPCLNLINMQLDLNFSIAPTHTYVYISLVICTVPHCNLLKFVKYLLVQTIPKSVNATAINTVHICF